MAPPHASLPPVAKPNHGNHFDAWNSSLSGRQMAENRLAGSTGWIKSRSIRLTHQYKSGGTGGCRVINCAGQGSKDCDTGSRTLTNKGVEERARTSVADMLLLKCPVIPKPETGAPKRLKQTNPNASDAEAAKLPALESNIFAGCMIYLNGSTQPIISDHKLKQMLAENGAKLSIRLGRRQVTHVILGQSCNVGAVRNGAGGGMAASKTEREIQKVGGCGIKYVGVEWVLESVKRGIRQPEARYANLRVALHGQRSVYNISRSGSRHF